MQAGFDRAARGAQSPGGLIGVEFFDMPEDDDLAVGLGEAGDAAANLCLNLGPLRTRGSRLGATRARKSSAPVFRNVAWEVLKGHHTPSVAGAGPPYRETGVDQDPVQPGPKRGVTLEGRDGPIGREKGVLDGVRAVLALPQEAAGNGKHTLVVLPDDAIKSLRVARANAIHE